jgi:type II secretion system protein H
MVKPAERDLRPISAVGRIRSPQRSLAAPELYRAATVRERSAAERGVTLIEMMVVMMIIAVIVAISTPSVSAGIDAVRLATATSSVAAFINAASTRAERRERPVELVISAKTLAYISTDAGSKQELNLPDGVSAEPISATPSEDSEGDSRWLFMPGGAIPSVAVKLSNQHGGQRIVKLDPMTGFPRVQRVEPQ